MTTTVKKDQFFANQKNKQQFIFMLSTELECSNCKTYHATGDADLLIIQSATTSRTVLVGEDTDLNVLLCYHASPYSHDLFFNPEPKKNTKSFVSCTSEPQKESLTKTSATTSSLSILFLDVTQHHIFMGLKRAHPLVISKQAVCSLSRQRRSVLIHDRCRRESSSTSLQWNVD